MIEQAYKGLFPEKEFDMDSKLRYSGRFNSYNANVRYTKTNITFNLSKEWRFISKEIQIGLLQSLMLKIFKKKKKTTNIDLYNNFMKHVHIAVPKTKTHPVHCHHDRPRPTPGANPTHEYAQMATARISPSRFADETYVSETLYHPQTHDHAHTQVETGRSPGP